MSKPIMLITGTSRGIGLACAKHFKDLYEIVGVSRTPGEFVTEVGDINDTEFRNMLVNKYTPQVFINNAGVNGSVKVDELLNTNVESAGFLLVKFYTKMTAGYIINISSWSANTSGGPKSGIGELCYKASKLFIKNLSNNLSNYRTKPVFITSLEPQIVYTTMMSADADSKPMTDIYENYDFKSYMPMSAEYIAETIQWIITQPPWVSIKSLEISNAYGNQ